MPPSLAFKSLTSSWMGVGGTTHTTPIKLIFSFQALKQAKGRGWGTGKLQTGVWNPPRLSSPDLFSQLNEIPNNKCIIQVASGKAEKHGVRVTVPPRTRGDPPPFTPTLHQRPDLHTFFRRCALLHAFCFRLSERSLVSTAQASGLPLAFWKS